jgi:hypothetical protein
MTHENSPNHLEINEELPAPFRMAVETILAEPVPKIDLARLIPDKPVEIATRSARRIWLARVGGGLLVGATAAALFLGLIVLRPASAWAQLAEAVRKQAWVHVVMKGPEGQAVAESWFSSVNKVAAGPTQGGTLFLDLGQNKLQRYDEKEKTIYVSEPTPLDREALVLLDTIFQAIANGKDSKKGGDAVVVKLVGQSQREIEEGDKRWTEHVLDFEHPQRTPPQFRQVFRVPAGEQLPTRMTQELVVDGKTVSRRVCDFDYPAEGPADLFAMDVPRDAKVVDLRANDSLKSLLAEFNQQRDRPLEPFSATVLESLPEFEWKEILYARRLRKDGRGLLIEQVFGEDFMNARRQVQRGELQIPDGADRVLWWKGEVAKMDAGLSHLHEAGHVHAEANEYNNNPLQAGYQPLSGFAADGTSRKSRLTLNPKPAVGPSDCVMVTAENVATGEKEQVFWFDPSRGHMIVRRESHQRAKPSDWIQTTIIDRAERSPKGRWYVTEYRCGQVEQSGDNLPTRRGVAPSGPTVYRILAEFDK